MQAQYLFDSDDFEQNIPLFAKTLSSVLRMRQRHGHLVRAVVDLSPFNSASSSHLGHFSFEVCGCYSSYC